MLLDCLQIINELVDNFDKVVLRYKIQGKTEFLVQFPNFPKIKNSNLKFPDQSKIITSVRPLDFPYLVFELITFHRSTVENSAPQNEIITCTLLIHFSSVYSQAYL